MIAVNSYISQISFLIWIGDESPIMPTLPIGGIMAKENTGNKSLAQTSVDGDSYLICIPKTIS
jgi:hypothetical protein